MRTNLPLIGIKKRNSEKDRPKPESESFFVAKLNDGTKAVDAMATRPSKNLIVLKHCGVQLLAIENDGQPKINYAFLK